MGKYMMNFILTFSYVATITKPASAYCLQPYKQKVRPETVKSQDSFHLSDCSNDIGSELSHLIRTLNRIRMTLAAVKLFHYEKYITNSYYNQVAASIHINNCIPVENNKTDLFDHFDKKQAYCVMYKELIKAFSFVNQILRSNYTGMLTANDVEKEKMFYIKNGLGDTLCSLKKLIKIQLLKRKSPTDQELNIFYSQFESAWDHCKWINSCQRGLICKRDEIQFTLQVKSYLGLKLRLIKKLCFTISDNDQFGLDCTKLGL